MKKLLFILTMVIISIIPSNVFGVTTNVKTSEPVSPGKTEVKLSDQEIARLKTRIDEISKIDKSKLTVAEKRALRKELKKITENVRKEDIYVISGSTLLLIILICICL